VPQHANDGGGGCPVPPLKASGGQQLPEVLPTAVLLELRYQLAVLARG
jgi:hypothetical protein